MQFDDAVIGTDYRDLRLVYSIERHTDTNNKRCKDMDEAVEYFDHNIGCAFVGDMTPLHVWTEDKVDL